MSAWFRHKAAKLEPMTTGPPIWFTSDTHFGHRMMATRWRPFDGDIDAMDDTLIRVWNSRIGPTDTVYHLGDFTFRNRGMSEYLLSHLNGQIHLIRGNHDHTTDRLRDSFASYSPYREIKVRYYSTVAEAWVPNQRIVLCHFPIQSWNQMNHGSWHLHGHCHNNLPQIPGKRLDVGVDNPPPAYREQFAPWSLAEVADFMDHQPIWTPGDHHTLGEPGTRSLQ